MGRLVIPAPRAEMTTLASESGGRWAQVDRPVHQQRREAVDDAQGRHGHILDRTLHRAFLHRGRHGIQEDLIGRCARPLHRLGRGPLPPPATQLGSEQQAEQLRVGDREPHIGKPHPGEALERAVARGLRAGLDHRWATRAALAGGGIEAGYLDMPKDIGLS
jgi:hypothetical protein